MQFSRLCVSLMICLQQHPLPKLTRDTLECRKFLAQRTRQLAKGHVHEYSTGIQCCTTPHKVGASHRSSGLGGASLVLWHVPTHEAEARLGWGKFTSIQVRWCLNPCVLQICLAVSGESLVKTRRLKVLVLDRYQLRHLLCSGVRALREAHNFSNGVHTLRQDEALHGFVHLVAGQQSDQQLINCKGWPVMLWWPRARFQKFGKPRISAIRTQVGALLRLELHPQLHPFSEISNICPVRVPNHEIWQTWVNMENDTVKGWSSVFTFK